jgi:hypothetical protein
VRTAAACATHSARSCIPERGPQLPDEARTSASTSTARTLLSQVERELRVTYPETERCVGQFGKGPHRKGSKVCRMIYKPRALAGLCINGSVPCRLGGKKGREIHPADARGAVPQTRGSADCLSSEWRSGRNRRMGPQTVLSGPASNYSKKNRKERTGTYRRKSPVQ